MSNSHDSHASDESYDHPIEHHDPSEGFDRSDPNTGAVWGFALGSVAALVLVIVALSGYFDERFQEEVRERVLTVPSSLLRDVRNRDAWNLTHYMYGDLDQKSGRVRIPVETALQSFAQEAAAGKLFYPAKATPIKVEEPDKPAAAPAATPDAKPDPAPEAK